MKRDIHIQVTIVIDNFKFILRLLCYNYIEHVDCLSPPRNYLGGSLKYIF